MLEKIVLLRNEKTGTWKYTKLDPTKFKSKSWPGYEYFGAHKTMHDAMEHVHAIVIDEQHKANAPKVGLPAVILPPHLTAHRQEFYPED